MLQICWWFLFFEGGQDAEFEDKNYLVAFLSFLPCWR